MKETAARIRGRGKFARWLVEKCDNGWTAEYAFKSWLSRVCPQLHNTHCVVFRLADTKEDVELALFMWCTDNGYG